jgi:hypothetical protein
MSAKFILKMHLINYVNKKESCLVSEIDDNLNFSDRKNVCIVNSSGNNNNFVYPFIAKFCIDFCFDNNNEKGNNQTIRQF